MCFLFECFCFFLFCFKLDVSSTELDLLPFVVTFVMSFWQVQYGIIGGVAVSGFLLLYSMARPQIKVLKIISQVELVWGLVLTLKGSLFC